MRTKLLLAALVTSTLLASTGISQARGGLPAPPLPPQPPLLPSPPGVNVNINAYLPAPPGVHVYADAGRPYYMEHGRRVYMKKKPKKHGHGHGEYGHKHAHHRH
jgi:hypothetical protein